jgi:hypothetical protein
MGQGECPAELVMYLNGGRSYRHLHTMDTNSSRLANHDDYAFVVAWRFDGCSRVGLRMAGMCDRIKDGWNMCNRF